MFGALLVFCAKCLYYPALYFVAGALHRPQRSADTQREGNSVNTSSPPIEVLRGRDGRDGRDGVPGPLDLKDKGETKE